MARQSIKVSYKTKGFARPSMPKIAVRRVSNGKRKA